LRLSNGQRVNCREFCDTLLGDPGRTRNPQDFTISNSDHFPGKGLPYAGPETIVQVIGQRDVNGKPPNETACFISSLENHGPAIAQAIRVRRGIENGLRGGCRREFSTLERGNGAHLL
jgi:hypothetical protein